MMKRHTKEIKERHHSVIITHDKLKSIVCNYLQDAPDIRAPKLPALKFMFMKDAAGHIYVEGSWRETID